MKNFNLYLLIINSPILLNYATFLHCIGFFKLQDKIEHSCNPHGKLKKMPKNIILNEATTHHQVMKLSKISTSPSVNGFLPETVG